MHSGFGRWILTHRGARIGLMAGLLPLPLTGVLSAALAVAVAIAKGWREAVVDCGIALLVLAAVTVVAGGLWSPVVVSGASTWVAAIFLGALTASYGSLTLTLQALLVLGVLGLTLFFVIAGDPVAFWERALREFAVRLDELGV
ncbi:MAG: hypothetical protein ACE5G3_10390 [Gammaproteobacteria bacterium]